MKDEGIFVYVNVFVYTITIDICVKKTYSTCPTVVYVDSCSKNQNWEIQARVSNKTL